MKYPALMAFMIPLVLAFQNGIHAQCVMRINDSLKLDREVHLILRSKTSIFTPTDEFMYQCGPYKMLDRSQSDKSIRDSELFTTISDEGHEITYSEYFTVLCNDKDTFRVVQLETIHLIEERREKAWTGGENTIPWPRKKFTVRYYEEAFSASFIGGTTRSIWNMNINNPRIWDSEDEWFSDDEGDSWSLWSSKARKSAKKFMDEFEFIGELYNDGTYISIRRVDELEKKSGILWWGHDHFGYEFFLDEKCIAAVQLVPLNSQDMKLWLSNDLDENMKNVIATAVLAKLLSFDAYEFY